MKLSLEEASKLREANSLSLEDLEASRARSVELSSELSKKLNSNFRYLIHELNHPGSDFFNEVAGVGAQVIDDFGLNSQWIDFLSALAGRFGNDIYQRQPLSPEQLVGYLVSDFNGVDSVSDLCLFLEKGKLVVDVIDSFPNYAELVNQGLINLIKLSDYQGQHGSNIDSSKRFLLGDTHYTNLICDLNVKHVNNLFKDYQLLKNAQFFEDIKVHYSVLTFTKFDQLIVPSKVDVTEDQLLKAYERVQLNRLGGDLVGKLSAIESEFNAESDVEAEFECDFDFLGVQVASARPWLGFYNSTADLLMIKYMHDFVKGGVAKVGYLGSGGHGKTQSLTVNNFIHRFDGNGFDPYNWYHDAETQGVISTDVKVFKEMFYNLWLGVGSLKLFDGSVNLTADSYLLNPSRVFRVAASLFPSAFGVELNAYEFPNKGFDPSVSSCVRMTNQYLPYANKRFDYSDPCNKKVCRSINDFEDYFGISDVFINNYLSNGLSRAKQVINQSLGEALKSDFGVDERTVKSFIKSGATNVSLISDVEGLPEYVNSFLNDELNKAKYEVINSLVYTLEKALFLDVELLKSAFKNV